MTRLMLVWCGALAACTSTSAGDAGKGVTPFRGLVAKPTQLAFTCVVPGCDTTLNVRVQSSVNRRVAVKRVILSTTNSDYTVTPEQTAPFILGAASEFNVAVRFVPTTAPEAADLDLLVSYTDAAAGDGADRIEPGELVVPLVRRLVGAPELSANPRTINFGVVYVGTQKSTPVKVSNAGFGNISLSVDGFDAGSDALTVTLPTAKALVPDAGVTMPVGFEPTAEQYLKTDVWLYSKTAGVEPLSITVEGTSYSSARVALEPEERSIDVGPIKKGGHAEVNLKVANLGGKELTITNVTAKDAAGNVKAGLTSGSGVVTLSPLDRTGITITVDGRAAGLIAASLVIESNDGARPKVEVPIIGTITEPKALVAPASLSWGTIPMGWVVSKSATIKNVGFGPLTVKNISFIGGTPTVYALKNLPALPAKLEKDQQATFEVEFRAETTAVFMGSVSVETDDATTPFSEVALSATGGSCQAGCPIAHGTASCASGKCGVGSCSAGWYDTNTSASDGCECQDTSMDPGSFCSAGLDKGTLPDNGASASYTGMLPTSDDVDFVRFFAQDESQLFGENYDVRITMQSSDPTIQMCVYRYDTAISVNECYLNNESCGRSFRKKGSYGSEDGAVYYIKVFRSPGSAPMCLGYTLYMVNG